jgi:putative transposase
VPRASCGLRYIRPSKPSQNAYNERFNTTGRTEVLDAHLFDELDQAREITETRLQRDNGERPHEAHGSLSPSAFREYSERKTPPLEPSA